MKIQCTICCMDGPKSRNEDAVFAKVYQETSKALFLVCDGMSGLHMGDAASQTIIDTFSSVWEAHQAEWSSARMLQKL